MVTESVQPDPALERAQQRLRAEKGFWIHLTVYLCVNAFLWLINSQTHGKLWAFWPAIGWGIGLAAHALVVFGLHGAARDWEARRLRELVDEERARR